jgi:hypothetical protein
MPQGRVGRGLAAKTLGADRIAVDALSDERG